ncbi:hypothetical protein MPTK2_Ug00270 [Marchantia polymorpha subsp. ruderalis]|uniref:Uncharacterized protein n=1 Tax=Marchantia polymorpha TaxID=3197 RepID=A0A2R6VZJ8_MARPO|nr:hypothetical protein MARPO_0240s0002 [Marchantia polymorpha]|eukprot:PTQ27021.1 hypothetical protein MARPO_0240s0002 [Marchantia polymorpha]
MEKMEGSTSSTLPKLPLRRCLEDISNSSEPNLPSAAVVDVTLGTKGKKLRVYHAPRRRRPYTSWTEEEDTALRAAVGKFKGRNWKKIAANVPNRSDNQCLNRWQKVLDPALVKGSWTKDEDDKLLEMVNEFGTKTWAAIARSLPSRNGKQCRERWCNNLDPQIKKEPWNEEEDMKLFLAHKRFGNSWSKIAKLIPGRSENGIKNRWNITIQKRADALEQSSENWINRNTFEDMLSIIDDVAPTELDVSEDHLALNGEANIDLQDSNAAKDLKAWNLEFDMDVDVDNFLDLPDLNLSP